MAITVFCSWLLCDGGKAKSRRMAKEQTEYVWLCVNETKNRDKRGVTR